MRRREFITLLGGAAAWPMAARAQQAAKIPLVGLLTAGSVPLLALPETFRELGWIEGKTIGFRHQYAQNRIERLPDLATELVRQNVDVIMAFGTLAPLAAKRATTNIPIVMASAGDPVATGLVASLARPGGNITGMSLMAPDLAGKRLALMKEILPQVARIGVLWNAANPYPALVFKETQNAGRALGIEVESLAVRSPDDFDTVLEAARRQRPDALIIVEDPMTADYRKLIADAAARMRLATLFGMREGVTSGGLISYGTNLTDLQRRAVGYVDRILRGARPEDLPIQQPTRFDLVINLQTAKTLGLEIPPTLLARADEVIE